MTQLRVFDIRRTLGEQAELSARVEGLPSGLGEERLWFRFPKRYEQWLGDTAEPFVAALLPIAMLLKRPLRIEGAVSPLFFAGCNQIADLYHRWDSKLALPGLEVAGFAPPRKPTGSAVGCFFTAGVDSFYTVLKNLDRETGDSRITHLVFVRGYADCPLDNEQLFAGLRAKLESIAAALRLELVISSTNLKNFTPAPGPGWDRHGSSQLVPAGLALARGFRRLYIPAGDAYATLSPWGSHPNLDPLWSLENLEFRHDGCEAYRSQKLEWYVATSRLALEHLRVCSYEGSGLQNCGCCEKCIRTQIGLAALGVTMPVGLFAENLDFQRVTKLDSGDRVAGHYLRDNLALLGRRGLRPDLEAAVRRTLRPRPFRWLSRHIQSAVREFDRRYLKGALRSWAVRTASHDARSRSDLRSGPTIWTLRQAWREVAAWAGRIRMRGQMS
jgi:hypothetical protein